MNKLKYMKTTLFYTNISVYLHSLIDNTDFEIISILIKVKYIYEHGGHFEAHEKYTS